MNKRFNVMALCLSVALLCLTAVFGADKLVETLEDDSKGAPSGHGMTFRELLAEGRQNMVAKRWDEALLLFTKAVEVEPDDSGAALALGVTLLALERFEEALHVLEPEFEKSPDRADLKNNLAWIYCKSTDPEIRDVKKAITYAREAVFSAPNAASIWGTLADAHYADSNYQKAFRAARIAVGLSSMQQGGGADSLEYWELYRRCSRAAGMEKEEVISKQ